MFKNKILLLGILICVAVVAIVSCSKVPRGYLATNMFYTANPYSASQGVATVSASLVANGSSTPLYVQLLAVRNLTTGADVTKLFSATDSVVAFKSAPDYTDSTLAKLNAKLTKSVAQAFSLADNGGRLQFTAASRNIPIGSYVMDIKATNEKGSITIPNACKINVIQPRPDSILSTGYTQANSVYAVVSSPPVSNLKVTMVRIPTGPNKVVWVFKDKNGANFNPAQGQVVNRPSRPYWHDWVPYYPQVKTDTSLEYAYPANVPSIPIISASSYAGYATGVTYWAVVGPANSTGNWLDGVVTPAIYVTTGTYVITLKFTDATKL
jgi:hypothetical protein